jgi:tRNA G10  N-methylase Trm11
VNSIHAFRPAAALQIYDRFKPTRILDPCAGWGGRALAAHIYGAAYTGYDCNLDLTDAYAAMTAYFVSGSGSGPGSGPGSGSNEPSRRSRPKVTLQIADSLRIDYSRIGSYDCVMTSPPYYNLERYPNNCAFTTDDDMDDRFYFPLFYAAMDYLQPGGWIVLSINEKLLHRVFEVLYGPPHVTFPLTAYKRKAYSENIYAWQK